MPTLAIRPRSSNPSDPGSSVLYGGIGVELGGPPRDDVNFASGDRHRNELAQLNLSFGLSHGTQLPGSGGSDEEIVLACAPAGDVQEVTSVLAGGIGRPATKRTQQHGSEHSAKDPTRNFFIAPSLQLGQEGIALPGFRLGRTCEISTRTRGIGGA